MKTVRLRISTELLKHRLEIPPAVDVIGVVWKPEFAAVDVLVVTGDLSEEMDATTARVVPVATVSELAEALAE